MNYDAKNSVVTRPGRDNFFSLESDINQIHKNKQLTNLLDAVPSGIILLNRFRQVLFCNSNVRELFANKNIDFGLRPGELLGCAFSNDSPYGCGEGPKCQVCGVVQIVNESAITKKKVSGEASIYLSPDNMDRAYEFFIAASPYTVDGLQLTLVSIEDISRLKKHYKLESCLYNSFLENTSFLEGSLNSLLTKHKTDDLQEFLFESKKKVHEIISELLNQKILFNAIDKKLTVKIDEIQSLDILSNCKTHYNSANLFIDQQPENFNLKTDFFLLNRALFILIGYIFKKTGPGSNLTLMIRKKEQRAVISIESNVRLNLDEIKKSFEQPRTELEKKHSVEPFSVKILIEEYLNGSISISDSEKNSSIFYIEISKDLSCQQ